MAKPAENKPINQWINSFKGQKIIITLLFMLIPLALLLIFTYIPAVNLIRYSVESRDRFGHIVEYTGLDNFSSIFSRSEYVIAFGNTAFYLLGYFVQIVLSIIFASILCSKIKFVKFFKGLIFFPYMINIVAVAFIFKQFFIKGDGVINAEGVLNSLIIIFGHEPIKWLTTEIIVNVCLAIVSIWRNIGFSTIVFMAAIQSIPMDIYESAKIDGANRLQKLIYIVIPNIRPILGLQILLAFRGAFSTFEIPYIMTAGRFGSSTFVTKTIETAFIFDKVGLASAMAVVLLFIIVVIAVIQKAAVKEDKLYGDKI